MPEGSPALENIRKRSKIFKARLASSRTRQQEADSASRTDKLTGLPNRRWLFEELSRKFSEGKRTGKGLWVVMADVDFFKRVNDELGHDVGDQVLQLFGNLKTRTEEPFARYGGEEFVQVLSDGDLMGIQKVVSRLSSEFKVSSEKILGRGATLSFGIARMEVGDTPDILMKKADMALYHSKNSGRDRATGLGGSIANPEYIDVVLLPPQMLEPVAQVK